MPIGTLWKALASHSNYLSTRATAVVAQGGVEAEGYTAVLAMAEVARDELAAVTPFPSPFPRATARSLAANTKRFSDLLDWEDGDCGCLPHASAVSVGDFQLAIWNVQRVLEGSENLVLRADSPEGEVFIRINQDQTIFPIEIAAYALFASHGIPVPRVLGYSERSMIEGYSMMVLTKAVGEPLGKSSLGRDQLRKLYSKAGEVLRKIHEIQVPGFGRLSYVGGVLSGTSSSWGSYWASRDDLNANFRFILQQGLMGDEEYQRVLEIFEEMKQTSIERASLLHRDFSSDHIFTDEREITGVIDLGDIMAGDSRYDIATSLVFLKGDQRKAFEEGYGELAGDPMVLKYLLFVAASKLAWHRRRHSTEGVQRMQQVLRDTFTRLSV